MELKKIPVDPDAPRFTISVSVSEEMIEPLTGRQIAGLACASFAKRPDSVMGLALVMDDQTFRTEEFGPHHILLLRDMLMQLMVNMFGEKNVAVAALMQHVKSELEELLEEEPDAAPTQH